MIDDDEHDFMLYSKEATVDSNLIKKSFLDTVIQRNHNIGKIWLSF